MDLTSYINDAANNFGLPPDLFYNQLQQESSLGTNLGTIGNIGQMTPPAIADVNSTFGTNFTSDQLAGDPIEGIWASAAYDSILYNRTGSYSGMLQSYGTVPSSGSFTPSQADLAAQATSLDWFGSSNAGAPVTNPNAPLSGIASSASISGVASKAGSFLAFITSGQGWERIGVIVIGIVLLSIAGFMLATKGFEGTIRTVAKA